MFSKPVSMLLAALVGLAGLHVVVAAPERGSECPSGKSDYCCGNPNPAKFTVNCHPYDPEVPCTGIRAVCEHTADGGMECGL